MFCVYLFYLIDFYSLIISKIIVSEDENKKFGWVLETLKEDYE